MEVREKVGIFNYQLGRSQRIVKEIFRSSAELSESTLLIIQNPISDNSISFWTKKLCHCWIGQCKATIFHMMKQSLDNHLLKGILLFDKAILEIQRNFAQI